MHVHQPVRTEHHTGESSTSSARVRNSHWRRNATHAQTLYGVYKYIQYSFDLYRQKAIIMQGRHASRGRHRTALKHHPRGENQRARGIGTPPGPRHLSLCLRPAQLTLYCSFGAGGIRRRRVFKRGMTPINWRRQIKGVASRALIKVPSGGARRYVR